MKLSQPQIQELYKFTQQHYVDWYDVQTELVDHLANGIELQCQNDTTITFDEAIKTEFKKFGVMGFSDLVEQKTKALNSYYRKQVWSYFRSYFKLPKITLTLAMVYGLFEVINHVESKLLVTIPIAIILFSIFILHLIKSVKGIKKKQNETGKKWLYENIILQLGGLTHFLNIGLYASISFGSNAVWNPTMSLVFSICSVLYFLTLHVSIKVVAPKIKAQLSKQHPEYNLV
jgi:hypothetical protein